MALVRIIMHWTAGGHTANATDMKHYHEIVEGDGTRVLGDKRPEANISTTDGHYVAHVARFNTGSIGLSMASMAGARERPFRKGNHAITEEQLAAFAEMVAEYCFVYDIPITRKTVLSHAEVPIAYPAKPQPGKWDITWIPGMSKPADPVDVGDTIREMVKEAYDRLYGAAAAAAIPADEPMVDEATMAALVKQMMRYLQNGSARH